MINALIFFALLMILHYSLTILSINANALSLIFFINANTLIPSMQYLESIQDSKIRRSCRPTDLSTSILCRYVVEPQWRYITNGGLRCHMSLWHTTNESMIETYIQLKTIWKAACRLAKYIPSYISLLFHLIVEAVLKIVFLNP